MMFYIYCIEFYFFRFIFRICNIAFTRNFQIKKDEDFALILIHALSFSLPLLLMSSCVTLKEFINVSESEVNLHNLSNFLGGQSELNFMNHE